MRNRSQIKSTVLLGLQCYLVPVEKTPNPACCEFATPVGHHQPPSPHAHNASSPPPPGLPYPVVRSLAHHSFSHARPTHSFLPTRQSLQNRSTSRPPSLPTSPNETRANLFSTSTPGLSCGSSLISCPYMSEDHGRIYTDLPSPPRTG